jgi:hypothetical protein
MFPFVKHQAIQLNTNYFSDPTHALVLLHSCSKKHSEPSFLGIFLR